ncbi:MAG: 1-acyl-sn-glycerol-3-phosphate acyltransferase [Spirochaetaceae bacterium]|jgi:1-acyl-sn-glycerol-3-phosphate acyltransferase|nr:1-acyl-sn-glycerol-3-phosphate acyltransferase [Spirochaetaceae bacterium]
MRRLSGGHFVTFYAFGFFFLCLVVLLPFGLVGMLVYFTPWRRAALFWTYKIGQGWAKTLIFLIGSSPCVVGRENIPKKGGVCFVSNHAGVYDIVLLLAYAGRPFGFIAKRELSFIPFLNVWIPILGGLFIDRKNPRKALATINEGVRNIQNGGSMLIFPEGTRSRGQGLLPFRAGAFKLALRSGMPALPVAISGTYESFERQGLFVRCPVTISFGKPIAAGAEGAEGERGGLAAAAYDAIALMLGDCRRATAAGR